MKVLTPRSNGPEENVSLVFFFFLFFFLFVCLLLFFLKVMTARASTLKLFQISQKSGIGD